MGLRSDQIKCLFWLVRSPTAPSTVCGGKKWEKKDLKSVPDVCISYVWKSVLPLSCVSNKDCLRLEGVVSLTRKSVNHAPPGRPLYARAADSIGRQMLAHPCVLFKHRAVTGLLSNRISLSYGALTLLIKNEMHNLKYPSLMSQKATPSYQFLVTFNAAEDIFITLETPTIKVKHFMSLFTFMF